jgi:hypothetical protein
MTTEALPCPFCGHVGLDFREGETFRWLAYYCGGCGMGSETRVQTLGNGTPEEWRKQAEQDALKEWNTRAQPAPEPFAYYVYFPDDQNGEYCDDLDDLLEPMTNGRHEVTPLYTRARPAAGPATCAWSQDGPDSDSWETGCGNYFRLDDGTPVDNDMLHCCFCGKPLDCSPYIEEEATE